MKAGQGSEVVAAAFRPPAVDVASESLQVVA